MKKPVINLDKMIISLLESNTESGIRLAAIFWNGQVKIEKPGIYSTLLVNSIRKWRIDWIGDIWEVDYQPGLYGDGWYTNLKYSKMLDRVFEE